MAAKNGHDEIVDLLLAQSRVDVDHAEDEVGTTPLFMAAQNGHDYIVLKLITHGADVNFKMPDGTSGASPLIAAAQCGHHKIVKLLLDAGADIKYGRLSDGKTTEEIAVEKGLSLVQLAIKSWRDETTMV